MSDDIGYGCPKCGLVCQPMYLGRLLPSLCDLYFCSCECGVVFGTATDQMAKGPKIDDIVAAQPITKLPDGIVPFKVTYVDRKGKN